MKTVYMDYAAATPVSSRVLKAMKPFSHDCFYNPASLYPEALKAKLAIEKARAKVAEALHGRSEEIIFVGSGTESVNLAILGSLMKAREVIGDKLEIVTTKIEHASVRETVKYCEKNSLAKVVYINVDEEGIVDPKEISKNINNKTALITIGMANNEIGVVQDIAEIGRLIYDYRKDNNSEYPKFHTDACQAPNYLMIDREHLKADLISLDGGKVYGPKGVGVLFIRNGTEINPIMHGGGQEKGLRPGTESVASIVGMGEALEETVSIHKDEAKRLAILQNYFFDQVERLIPNARITGSRKSRLPNNIHICIPGINSEFMTIALGEKGIMASPGSACNNTDLRPSSYVLQAIGQNDCVSSSLRFSMGRGTTKRDIDKVVQVLRELL